MFVHKDDDPELYSIMRRQGLVGDGGAEAEAARERALLAALPAVSGLRAQLLTSRDASAEDGGTVEGAASGARAPGSAAFQMGVLSRALEAGRRVVSRLEAALEAAAPRGGFTGMGDATAVARGLRGAAEATAAISTAAAAQIEGLSLLVARADMQTDRAAADGNSTLAAQWSELARLATAAESETVSAAADANAAADAAARLVGEVLGRTLDLVKGLGHAESAALHSRALEAAAASVGAAVAALSAVVSATRMIGVEHAALLASQHVGEPPVADVRTALERADQAAHALRTVGTRARGAARALADASETSGGILLGHEGVATSLEQAIVASRGAAETLGEAVNVVAALVGGVGGEGGAGPPMDDALLRHRLLGTPFSRTAPVELQAGPAPPAAEKAHATSKPVHQAAPAPPAAPAPQAAPTPQAVPVPSAAPVEPAAKPAEEVEPAEPVAVGGSAAAADAAASAAADSAPPPAVAVAEAAAAAPTPAAALPPPTAPDPPFIAPAEPPAVPAPPAGVSAGRAAMPAGDAGAERPQLPPRMPLPRKMSSTRFSGFAGGGPARPAANAVAIQSFDGESMTVLTADGELQRLAIPGELAERLAEREREWQQVPGARALGGHGHSKELEDALLNSADFVAQLKDLLGTAGGVSGGDGGGVSPLDPRMFAAIRRVAGQAIQALGGEIEPSPPPVAAQAGQASAAGQPPAEAAARTEASAAVQALGRLEKELAKQSATLRRLLSGPEKDDALPPELRTLIEALPKQTRALDALRVDVDNFRQRLLPTGPLIDDEVLEAKGRAAEAGAAVEALRLELSHTADALKAFKEAEGLVDEAIHSRLEQAERLGAVDPSSAVESALRDGDLSGVANAVAAMTARLLTVEKDLTGKAETLSADVRNVFEKMAETEAALPRLRSHVDSVQAELLRKLAGSDDLQRSLQEDISKCASKEALSLLDELIASAAKEEDIARWKELLQDEVNGVALSAHELQRRADELSARLEVAMSRPPTSGGGGGGGTNGPGATGALLGELAALRIVRIFPLHLHGPARPALPRACKPCLTATICLLLLLSPPSVRRRRRASLPCHRWAG